MLFHVLPEVQCVPKDFIPVIKVSVLFPEAERDSCYFSFRIKPEYKRITFELGSIEMIKLMVNDKEIKSLISTKSTKLGGGGQTFHSACLLAVLFSRQRVCKTSEYNPWLTQDRQTRLFNYLPRCKHWQNHSICPHLRGTLRVAMGR